PGFPPLTVLPWPMLTTLMESIRPPPFHQQSVFRLVDASGFVDLSRAINVSLWRHCKFFAVGQVKIGINENKMRERMFESYVGTDEPCFPLRAAFVKRVCSS